MNEALGEYVKMINLILAIVCSMLISVLMRVSEKYRKNHISMLAVNYLMCCIVAMFAAGNPFPKIGGLPVAILLGTVSGVLFLVSFILLQWNISKNGVVLPATFMRLGVLVPTVLSILIFGEKPQFTQIIGIIAAVVAIVVMQEKAEDEGKIHSRIGLMLLLIGGGVTDFMSKVYEQIGSAELSNQYLFYIFAVALIMCVGLCIYKKQKLSRMDVAFGLAIGIPNYFSTLFLLKSLEEIPAVVAYPSYSVGTIILIAVVSMILFKERLSRRKWIAMAVILAALALLNL